MVKINGSPILETPPFVRVGITWILTTNGSDVIFCAVNWLITPVPSSVWVKLIAVASPSITCHWYVVVPASTVEVNSMDSTDSLWQTTIFSIGVTPVIGLTVTVYV